MAFSLQVAVWYELDSAIIMNILVSIIFRCFFRQLLLRALIQNLGQSNDWLTLTRPNL